MLRSDLSDSSRDSLAVLVELIEPDQHIPRLASIRWTQNSSVVQLVDNPGSTTVADPEPPLQQGGGTSKILQACFGRLAEERVSFSF
jgi:hypothetical protein